MPQEGYRIALRALYEIGTCLSSTANQYTGFRQTLRTLRSFLNIRRGMVLLHDSSRRDLYIASSCGIDPDQAREVRYELGDGIVGKVFRHGVPMLVPDISTEPAYLNRMGQAEADESHSFLAVPIRHEGTDIGVLAIDRSAHSVASYEAEFELLKMIASMLGAFIRKVRVVEEQKRRLQEQAEALGSAQASRSTEVFEGLIGSSKIMRQVFHRIRLVANSDSSVLLRGESGTGKEVVARTIHRASPRVSGPFVALNCAAIPAELIESELFGHERGAFTGAHARKRGKFELAAGGTLFLDEIGDMPFEAQSKLLRVLQEREFERVGGQETLDADVRVIAATNRELEAEVRAGSFRLDLYYRLNVVPIFLPPLRKRVEDIPDLARDILRRLCERLGRDLRLTQGALGALMRCSWPGNVRELENCIERAALLSECDLLDEHALPCSRGELCQSMLLLDGPVAQVPPAADSRAAAQLEPRMSYGAAVADAPEWLDARLDERDRLLAALREAGWVQARAARLLGMTPRQIKYRIQKYDIELRQY